jgi:succinate dehydrogenase hydrophobic anchor subunit
MCCHCRLLVMSNERCSTHHETDPSAFTAVTVTAVTVWLFYVCIHCVQDDETVCAKINQDRGSITYPFMGSATAALLCVFDGHGEHGDKVIHKTEPFN